VGGGLDTRRRQSLRRKAASKPPKCGTRRPIKLTQRVCGFSWTNREAFSGTTRTSSGAKVAWNDWSRRSAACVWSGSGTKPRGLPDRRTLARERNQTGRTILHGRQTGHRLGARRAAKSQSTSSAWSRQSPSHGRATNQLL